jgi:Flp pilus assembly protein TadB
MPSGAQGRRRDMLLIALSICVGIFAIAVLAMMTWEQRVEARNCKARRAGSGVRATTGEKIPISAEASKIECDSMAQPLADQNEPGFGIQPVSVSGRRNHDARNLLLTSIAGSAVLGCVLYLRFGATLPALLLSAGFLPLPFLYVRRKRTKRLFKLEQQLPEALGMMVSALRVGHSLIASLGAVAQESRSRFAEKCASASTNKTSASTCALRS